MARETRHPKRTLNTQAKVPRHIKTRKSLTKRISPDAAPSFALGFSDWNAVVVLSAANAVADLRLAPNELNASFVFFALWIKHHGTLVSISSHCLTSKELYGLVGLQLIQLKLLYLHCTELCDACLFPKHCDAEERVNQSGRRTRTYVRSLRVRRAGNEKGRDCTKLWYGAVHTDAIQSEWPTWYAYWSIHLPSCQAVSANHLSHLPPSLSIWAREEKAMWTQCIGGAMVPASVHVGIDYTVHTHVRIETRYCVWFGNTFRPMQLCCKHLTTWIDVEKINGPNVIFQKPKRTPRSDSSRSKRTIPGRQEVHFLQV